VSNEEPLSEEVIASIRAGLSDESVQFYHPAEFIHIIRSDLDDTYHPGNLVFAGEAEWRAGRSKQFVKDIKGLDAHQANRLSKIISEITKDPLKFIRKTQEPLTGDKTLKGIWRRRVGNHRLFYKPDIESKTVLFISYDSRGQAYRKK